MTKLHTIGLYLTVIAAFSCGDDSMPSYSGSSDAAASCEQLAGTWTITEHCGAALKGSTVTVTQTQCSITTQGAFPGFTGEVKPDGSFNLSGTANGMNVSCTGTAQAKRISETCTGDCQVVLSR